MSNSTGRARRGRTIAGREEPAGLCCRPARLALSTARQAKSDYPKPRDETAALPGAKCGGRACPIKRLEIVWRVFGLPVVTIPTMEVAGPQRGNPALERKRTGVTAVGKRATVSDWHC